MSKVNIKDVAREAEVSTSLVSRVMNAPLTPDGKLDCVVNPKTAERIFKAVKKLGYHPNKAAASLRKSIKKRIGIIIPDISNQFFADIARHFEHIAGKSGYIVLFGSSDEDPDKLDRVADTFIEDGVDGIIIVPCADCERAVQKIIDNGTHVVLATRDIPSIPDISKVIPDDYESTKLVIEHLQSQGYNEIEMISNTRRLSTIKNREELFLQYMAAIGLKTRIHHYSPQSPKEDFCYILENITRRKVQAIYCPSASLSLKCLEECRQMGIRIPEDIALIGYDGGRIFRIVSPQISQIEYSREEIADQAFDLLMKQIVGNDKTAKTVMLKPQLTISESTIRKESDGPRISIGKDSPDFEHIITSLKGIIADLEQF